MSIIQNRTRRTVTVTAVADPIGTERTTAFWDAVAKLIFDQDRTTSRPGLRWRISPPAWQIPTWKGSRVAASPDPLTPG